MINLGDHARNQNRLFFVCSLTQILFVYFNGGWTTRSWYLIKRQATCSECIDWTLSTKYKEQSQCSRPFDALFSIFFQHTKFETVYKHNLRAFYMGIRVCNKVHMPLIVSVLHLTVNLLNLFCHHYQVNAVFPMNAFTL